MTGEHFEAILKTALAKHEKDGWWVLPDGGALTLHVAHDGASLNVSRVEAVRVDGELIHARLPKKDVVVLAREDVFAVALEGASATGQVRRAGFG